MSAVIRGHASKDDEDGGQGQEDQDAESGRRLERREVGIVARSTGRAYPYKNCDQCVDCEQSQDESTGEEPSPRTEGP